MSLNKPDNWTETPGRTDPPAKSHIVRRGFEDPTRNPQNSSDGEPVDFTPNGPVYRINNGESKPYSPAHLEVKSENYHLEP